MNLIIHRGTQEIGGGCVELRTSKTKILIDFGMPLVDQNKQHFDSSSIRGKSVEDLKASGILPAISGLYKGEAKEIDAILISHSHMDHYGLLDYISQDIPVYISRGAEVQIEISNIFTPNKLSGVNARTIKHKRPFEIGDIKITPYLVDHSACDALAFLVEAEGKRIFYSGDFRGHGRKSELYNHMITNPPDGIDCLLMEGSCLGRNDSLCKDETAVQKRMEEILRETQNITFLFASPQNIDRLVSAYKACHNTDSIFVIDIYAAYTLDKLRVVSKHIPQFDWRNVRVKFDKHQADTLAKKVSTQLLYHYNKRKIDKFEINRKKHRILMMARDNSIFPSVIKGIDQPAGSKIIYSMWEGYLTDKFKQYCKDKGLLIEPVHTSGHATLEDLKTFAAALKPKTHIPIHTFYPEKYKDLFANVQVLKDGEILVI